MLARTTPGGAVCLRCRLHLFPLRTRSIQAANHGFHRQHKQRCFSSDSGNDPGENGSGDAPKPSANANFSEFENIFAPDKDKNPFTPDEETPHYQHLNRTRTRDRPSSNGSIAMQRPSFMRERSRRSGNRMLTEGFESLGSHMLGKPAHAIVMKERAFKKKQLGSLPEDEVASLEMADFMTGKASPASPEESRANIDELRPTSETSLSERQFRKIQFRLTEGFLSSQLTYYINHHKKHIHPQQDSNPTNRNSVKIIAEYGWLKSVSPWAPVRQDTSGVETGAYMSASHTNKERLAIRIIRDCWQISILELSAGVGEVKVKMQPTEYSLLLDGQQRFLNDLAEKLLDPGETIEAYPEKNTIKFTCTKPKADFLLQEMDTTLQRIETKTIPLSLISPEPIEDKFLEEVGRITKTLVRRSRTLKRIHVTWVGLAEEAKKQFDKVEDLRHTVFRLLLTSFGGRAPITSLYASKAFDPMAGRYVVDKTNQANWSWRNKLEQWARYIVPTEARSSESRPVRALTDDQEHPAQFIHDLPFPITTSQGPLSEVSAVRSDNNGFYLESQYPVHPVEWSDAIKTTTVAHFGHLLHKHEPDTQAPPSLPDLLTANHPRIFSPTTPHPIRVVQLASAGQSSPVETRSSILIRFWPSPSIKTSPANDENNGVDKSSSEDLSPTRAPILELRLAITDDDFVAGVESFRAVLSTSTSDVLFPASMSDLRLTSTQTCDLVAGGGEIEGVDGTTYNPLLTWQPLRTFLSHARLELRKGNLEMPPRQRFPIPRRLFAGWQGSEKSGAELQGVTYEYVGLELQRSVALAHKGWKTTYTAVEAGQGGGRRTELAMEPVVVVSSPSNCSEEVVDGKEAAEEAAEYDGDEEFASASSSSSPNYSVDTDGGDDGAIQPKSEEEMRQQIEAREREHYLLSLLQTNNKNMSEAETEAEDGDHQGNEEELRRDFLTCCHEVATSEELWTGVPLEKSKETNASW